MSGHEGARVIGAEVAAVVGVEPSVYRVDGVPVACNIIAFFVDETSPHSNVRMTRQQTITTSTLLSRVEGAPAGGIGVVSGLPAGGWCKFARHGGERGQVSVKINGHEVVAEGDFYHMDGGNIEGIVTYVVAAAQGVYSTTAGERFQLGEQTWMNEAGGRAFGPGEQAFQAGVHWMVGFFNATAVPAWDGATSLAHGAWDAGTYLATTTKQDWYEDAAAMAPGVLSAGADVVDAAMHPIDTFWAGWDAGTAWASDTWASQKDAFYADPAFTVGDWMGNAANAYFLVKDGVAAVNAMREARAARQAAALVKAEREAAEALAREEALARQAAEAAEALAKEEAAAKQAAEAAARTRPRTPAQQGVNVTAENIFSESDVPPEELWNGPAYRGDRRHPAEVKAAGGFYGVNPQGDISLMEHMRAGRPPSQWVSASQSPDIAARYAYMPNGQFGSLPGPDGALGYTYHIRAPGGANVNLYNVANSSNLEIAYQGIPWKHVEGWTLHSWPEDLADSPFHPLYEDEILHFYAPNPDFEGPLP